MILLTGASGFIGSHLLSLLLKGEGLDVVALTSAPIGNAKYILHNGYRFNKNLVVEAGYANLIDTIIHVGAYTPKNARQANNIEKCNQNISSLEKLLNLNLPHLKKIVFLSTLDVYDFTDVISENTLIKPATLYGHSKLYGEEMVISFAQSSRITAQILRIGHVYGPGEESYQKIIPMTMKNLIAGEPVEIWGDGSDLRAFIYIDDVIKAIMNAVALPDDVGPINVVSEKSVSIGSVVRNIIEISEKPVDIKFIPQKGVPKNLIFNTKKMTKFLLPSETDLKKGLKMEWDYMLNLNP